MKVKQKLHSLCSRSWQACAPPPPGGALPAVTGLSLSTRQLRSRKVRTSSRPIFIRSLRKTRGLVGTVPCRQLAPGRMGPDHPLTAHLSAAPEIQVRPGETCKDSVCAKDRSLSFSAMDQQTRAATKCLRGIHPKSMKQFSSGRREREKFKCRRCFALMLVPRKRKEPG